MARTRKQATARPALEGQWKLWIERITGDVVNVRVHHYVFRRWLQVVSSNRALDQHNRFFGWIWTSALQTIALGIRRQLKPSPPQVSLVRLIKSLQDHPTPRRTHFVERYAFRDDLEGIAEANRIFDHFAGAGKEDLDGLFLAADIAALKSTCRAVERFVDKHVAHAENPAEPWPALDQIDEALDKVWNMALLYHELVWGGPFNANVPAMIDNEGWESIFDVPWRGRSTPTPAKA